jgi:hypothetical protein
MTSTPTSLPIYIRPPRDGELEFYSGLSRAKLYQLEADGYILGCSLRKPGQTKATKVFDLQSILDYIASQMAKKEAAR